MNQAISTVACKRIKKERKNTGTEQYKHMYAN